MEDREEKKEGDSTYKNNKEERDEKHKTIRKVGIGGFLAQYTFLIGIFTGVLISKCPEGKEKTVERKESVKYFPVPTTPKVHVEGKEVVPRKEDGEEKRVGRTKYLEEKFPSDQTFYVKEITKVFQREITCYDYDFFPNFVLAPEKFWNKREVDIIFAPGITFYCQIQDYRFPCPVISAKLTIQFNDDGEKHFEVFFEDNRKTCVRKILEHKFTIDTFPPTTTIVAVGFSDFTTSPDISFKFITSEPVAYTLCKLDEGYWIDCSGGEITLTNVSDGWHTLWAYSVDLANNEEMERKKYIFRVDAKPPITLLISAPPKVTNVSYAEFVFEANEPDVRFECNLDEAGWLPCESPLRVTEVKPGLHIMKIRAIDSMGRYEEEPVTYSWSVIEGEISGPLQPYIPPKSVRQLIELRRKQKELEEELKRRRKLLQKEKQRNEGQKDAEKGQGEKK